MSGCMMLGMPGQARLVIDLGRVLLGELTGGHPKARSLPRLDD